MGFLHLLESLRTPFLDSFFSLFTHVGDEMVFIAVAVLIYWCIGKKQAYYMMVVGFIGITVNLALKMIFRIDRPWVQDPTLTIVEAARERAESYAFPSAHSQNIVCVTGTFFCCHKNKVIRTVCVIMALLVMFSRMYLGVHTPLDVGVACASSLLLVAIFAPFFVGEGKEKSFFPLLGIMAAFGIGLVAFMYLYPFPADVDEASVVSTMKNAYTLLGSVLAAVSGYYVEKTFVRFDEKAPLPVQAVKLAAGFGLVMLIRGILKAPLALLFGGHPACHAVRYFIIAFFAVAVWPLTFRPMNEWYRRFIGKHTH